LPKITKKEKEKQNFNIVEGIKEITILLKTTLVLL
jgi:hypothetical protein